MPERSRSRRLGNISAISWPSFPSWPRGRRRLRSPHRLALVRYEQCRPPMAPRYRECRSYVRETRAQEFLFRVDPHGVRCFLVVAKLSRAHGLIEGRIDAQLSGARHQVFEVFVKGAEGGLEFLGVVRVAVGAD